MLEMMPGELVCMMLAVFTSSVPGMLEDGSAEEEDDMSEDAATSGDAPNALLEKVMLTLLSLVTTLILGDTFTRSISTF